MSDLPPTLLRRILTALPLLAVALVLCWSLLVIATRQREANKPEVITLSIGHWQLESGVRDAFNAIAADYARDVNPNVRIVQQAIPDSIYGQWASTQLMGGTAPDLIEIGKGLTLPAWVAYQSRYCVPLTADSARPNPYNADDSDFAKLPLRGTYKDGMRAGYVEELQEYMAMPLSQFVVRIFYNRDLLKKLTGSDQPPKDFDGFVALCDSIRAHKDPSGRPYSPIACSSSNHMWMWEQQLLDGSTYPWLKVADYNRDGALATDELFVGVRSGVIKLDGAQMQTKLAMLDRLLPNFQAGFTGLQRDEAVFAFAQQRAVFMTTGTWDARSLREQTKNQFEVGVMDFPIPATGSPLASAIPGPMYDKPMIGISFAVTRASKHRELAIDFLRYLASRRVNEKFNSIVGWIPTIRNTALDPILKPFAPHLEGVYGTTDMFLLGGETSIGWAQLFSLYQSGQLSATGLQQKYGDFYADRGRRDFDEVKRGWTRTADVVEQSLAELRGRALLSGSNSDSTLWRRYRLIVQARQLTAARDQAREAALADGSLPAPAQGPYEYRAEALARVKASLAAEAGR